MLGLLQRDATSVVLEPRLGVHLPVFDWLYSTCTLTEQKKANDDEPMGQCRRASGKRPTARDQNGRVKWESEAVDGTGGQKHRKLAKRMPQVDSPTPKAANRAPNEAELLSQSGNSPEDLAETADTLYDFQNLSCALYAALGAIELPSLYR